MPASSWTLIKSFGGHPPHVSTGKRSAPQSRTENNHIYLQAHPLGAGVYGELGKKTFEKADKLRERVAVEQVSRTRNTNATIPPNPRHRTTSNYAQAPVLGPDVYAPAKKVVENSHVRENPSEGLRHDPPLKVKAYRQHVAPTCVAMSDDEGFVKKHRIAKEPTHSSGYTTDRPRVITTHREPIKQPEPCQVHWLVASCLQLERRRRPPLYFNLARDFGVRGKKNLVYSHELSFPEVGQRELNQPVADVDSLCITCDDVPKAWEMWIFVKAERPGSFVRNIDVFKKIYDAFNKPMSPKEKEAIPPSQRERCESAFEKRCMGSVGLTEYNKKQGMRRVDILQGKAMFESLTWDKDKCLWKLRLCRPYTAVGPLPE